MEARDAIRHKNVAIARGGLRKRSAEGQRGWILIVDTYRATQQPNATTAARRKICAIARGSTSG
ncbi:hypothetical protein ZHAS_00021348 [Anopheles sinensis]|uniref:Uncharacterized protein n=1 Tax=Anopheles sinensis TaxID=74873 RepID=A0A084WS53_ANOSI|nr:hypothetical protein ZHAS_00021348 [Anopheles sinensis]